MSRFRTLDPDLWAEPCLAPLSVHEMFLLIGLVSNADDDGRMHAQVLVIRDALYKYGRHGAPSPRKVEAMLERLHELKQIVLYKGPDRRTYLALRGWKDGRSWQYQSIRRRRLSKLPAPPEGSCPEVPRGKGADPKNVTPDTNGSR